MDTKIAGARLNESEQAKLDRLARRIRGSRTDVFKAFINYFTEDELAERVAEVLRDPNSQTSSPVAVAG